LACGDANRLVLHHHHQYGAIDGFYPAIVLYEDSKRIKKLINQNHVFLPRADV
jgi:hypothetical protein